MFENLNETIFSDIGETLKKISKFLFNFCLIIGAIVAVVGAMIFLSGIDEYTSFLEGLACTQEDAIEYDSLYASCYYGKVVTKFGFWIAFSSLTVLPLYAFGELVNSAKKSKELLMKLNSTKQGEVKKETVNLKEVAEFSKKETVSEHKWLCSNCGKLIDKSPCPYCGNE